VLALPPTEETRGAIDARRLGLMDASSYLINVARDPLIDEAALFEALESRRIAGAAIDVWYRYPKDADEPAPPSAMPFQDLDNVIMTPHAAGNTTATFGQRAGDIIDNIERLDRGEPLRNVVGAEKRRSQ
jgi:phosphoglycerate dehydrogenase-like enzyme